MDNIISIVGASGFIGSWMFRYLTENLDKSYCVKGTYYSNKSNEQFDFLDITNTASIEGYVEVLKPNILILLAGTKNVKKCEDDFDYAYSLNTKPVKDFISAISTLKSNTKFIFFSSDYVFDGQRGNYTVEDKPNPTTNYGKTNALSEDILIASNINYKIIRTSAVMGRGSNFFDWVVNSLYQNIKIGLFSDSFFTPTPVQFLNEIVCPLLSVKRPSSRI